MKRLGYVGLAAFVVGVGVALNQLAARQVPIGQTAETGLSVLIGIVLFFAALLGIGKALRRLDRGRSQTGQGGKPAEKPTISETTLPAKVVGQPSSRTPARPAGTGTRPLSSVSAGETEKGAYQPDYSKHPERNGRH